MIVKNLKGLVGKVCSEEHGHLVLLALFDCVDDTVLVKKAVLSVSEIYSCCHGNVLVNSVPSSHVTNSLPPLYGVCDDITALVRHKLDQFIVCVSESVCLHFCSCISYSSSTWQI